MKKFVIGDIHGNYKELKELLYKINPDYHNDELTFWAIISIEALIASM